MTDLREFLLRRWKEVSAEKRPVDQRVEELSKELVELRNRQTQLQAEAQDIRNAADAIKLNLTQQRGEESAKEKTEAKVTIKSAILRVLKEVAPGGLTSNQILDRINLLFFQDGIERTSFSPQLSRLKAAGKIKSDGSRYFFGSIDDNDLNEFGADTDAADNSPEAAGDRTRSESINDLLD